MVVVGVTVATFVWVKRIVVLSVVRGRSGTGLGPYLVAQSSNDVVDVVVVHRAVVRTMARIAYSRMHVMAIMVSQTAVEACQAVEDVLVDVVLRTSQGVQPPLFIDIESQGRTVRQELIERAFQFTKDPPIGACETNLVSRKMVPPSDS